jgi:hypothetical protein
MNIRLHGFTLVLVLLLLAASACALLSFELATSGAAMRRDTIGERALAQAREALIAYAADRPISASVGPGYLPCPDLDDDGWAESTCGSLAGESGQASRLGRLPWKTLGLPDLRDGHGERLWYAVSTKHKGLLNCGASRACDRHGQRARRGRHAHPRWHVDRSLQSGSRRRTGGRHCAGGTPQ